jgi:nucleotide-binding universal stress UspA family protein
MGMGRLVVGDDSSAEADVVWLWVNNHRWPGWRISVVTARPPEEWTPLPPERTHLHRWEPPHPRRLLCDGDRTEVEHLVAEADPRIVLDSVPDASLVAVGPHGAGRLGLHIGSTTEWLLHRPTTPVVVVRSARTTERVLVCTDGSAHARRAARAAAALPWIGECDVRVLAVRTGRGDVDAGVAEASEALRAGGVEPTAQILDREVYPTGRGDVRDLLLREVADGGADLVVLGTAGTGGWRRAVIGSTASAVVHRAPCSVLVAYDADAG